MIPVRKLYKNFTGTGNYVFVFPAAYDTIQMMVKFTATDASDTLSVAALEKNAAGTVIEFVADGFPITGVIGTTGQIYLFDWKTPAMKVTFTQAGGAGSCEVFVKTFSNGLQDVDPGTTFTAAVDHSGAGSGMFETWGTGGSLLEGA